jgi:hypothetical protein
MPATLQPWVAQAEPEVIRTADPFFVGVLVRKQFLLAVDAVCDQARVDWDWETRRGAWLTGKVVVTLRGPASRVSDAETSIRKWVLSNLASWGAS